VTWNRTEGQEHILPPRQKLPECCPPLGLRTLELRGNIVVGGSTGRRSRNVEIGPAGISDACTQRRVKNRGRRVSAQRIWNSQAESLPYSCREGFEAEIGHFPHHGGRVAGAAKQTEGTVIRPLQSVGPFRECHRTLEPRIVPVYKSSAYRDEMQELPPECAQSVKFAFPSVASRQY